MGDPPVDERIKNSWHCVFVILAISFSGAGLVMNGLVVMNPMTPAIKQTYSEIYQNRYGVAMSNGTWTTLLALTMSMLYVGGLFGSLLVNPLLRRFTRKHALLPIHIINGIGLIAIAIGVQAAHSYEMVICGRLIVGVSLGLGFAVFPLVVNEYCVPHTRLHYGAVLGGLYSFAGLISIIVAWPMVLGRYENYLGALLYGLVYPVMYLLCMYWIPETPYQAILNDNAEKSLEILRKLRTGSQAAMKQMEITRSGKQIENSKCGSVLGEAKWTEIFTSRQFRKHFTAVVILFSYLSGCGISNVSSFSDKIFTEAGLPKDAVTPATMSIYGVSTIFAVIGVALMKKFDPKSVILCCSCSMAVSHALMTAATETFQFAREMSWVSMAAMWIFMACFSVMKTLVFGVLGVLCVDRTRSKSLLVGGAFFWAIGWAVGFIAPYLTEWIQGYSFLVWMAITILCTIYIYFCVPRTKDKSEEEIQEFFLK